jgi:NADH-quinone oxidoreductase subunit N
LAASDRRREESQESGLKYFILGGFASAFLLYGIALVYGATASTNINGIAECAYRENCCGWFGRNVA